MTDLLSERRARSIRGIVLDRGIEDLTHFTDARNLGSILRHGLLPRSFLERDVADGYVNDGLRLDGRDGAICLSVSFPNHRMLWKVRNERPDVDFVVLVLSPDVLWTNDCAFSPVNAADHRVRGVSIDRLRDPAVFEEMFAGRVGRTDRPSGLDPAFPTDDQAEILVLDPIVPTMVRGVVFDSVEALERHAEVVDDLPVAVVHEGDAGVFARRGLDRI